MEKKPFVRRKTSPGGKLVLPAVSQGLPIRLMPWTGAMSETDRYLRRSSTPSASDEPYSGCGYGSDQE
jgi:hypothetical protein